MMAGYYWKQRVFVRITRKSNHLGQEERRDAQRKKERRKEMKRKCSRKRGLRYCLKTLSVGNKDCRYTKSGVTFIAAGLYSPVASSTTALRIHQ
jgi:hypothetical protein